MYCLLFCEANAGIRNHGKLDMQPHSGYIYVPTLFVCFFIFIFFGQGYFMCGNTECVYESVCVCLMCESAVNNGNKLNIYRLQSKRERERKPTTEWQQNAMKWIIWKQLEATLFFGVLKRTNEKYKKITWKSSNSSYLNYSSVIIYDFDGLQNGICRRRKKKQV